MVRPPEPGSLMLHPEAPDDRASSSLGHAGFRYSDAPDLFCGRAGEGPLVLAFDTNIVIPLTQRFDDVVTSLGFVGLQPSLWDDPDGALQDLFAVWFWRHVSVHISSLVLVDAKKGLDERSEQLRMRALETFAQDRWLRDADPDERSSVAQAPPRLEELPPGRDGELVRDAVSVGAHAFVTFDRGIHRYDEVAKRWGLRLCEPAWLLRALADSGEFSALPVGALPPVADLLMLSELYGLVDDEADLETRR